MNVAHFFNRCQFAQIILLNAQLFTGRQITDGLAGALNLYRHAGDMNECFVSACAVVAVLYEPVCGQGIHVHGTPFAQKKPDVTSSAQ